MAKPPARNAAAGSRISAMPPVPPEGLLPPLRRAETSVAAMLAMLSPPMPPYVISRPSRQPVAAPQAADHNQPPAREVSASRAEALAA
jgi:hypothetical protein